MKRILILFFLFNGWQLFAQNLELSGGLNYNIFYEAHRNDHPGSNFYLPATGYQFGVGMNDIRPDTFLKIRLTLNYINYGGVFRANAVGGLGSGGSYSGSISKSVISFGFYPLNVHLFHRIDFSLGLEIARLVYEKIGGENSYNQWQMGSGNSPGTNETGKLSDKYHPFSASGYLGVAARLAYPIRLNERLSITPQLGYYYGGLAAEFKPENYTRSFRQYFSIGIQRKLR